MIAKKIKLFFAHCKLYSRWVKMDMGNVPYKIHVFFKPWTIPTYMIMKVFDPIIKQNDKDLRGE